MDKNKLKSLLISTDTTLKESMQKLNKTAEKILFILDKNSRLIGTVTDGDIRRGLLHGMDFHNSIKKIIYHEFRSLKMGTVDINKQAKKLMLKYKIEQIPIVDEKGAIVDVILWADLFDIKKAKRKVKYPNQIVIMAGGKGARLDPFTRILPKSLIPIGNKTVIEVIMDKFNFYGFHKFIFTLGYKKEYIKLYLMERNFPYHIEWVEEDDFLGTAGSLSLLKDKILDTFFVMNCDSLVDVDFKEILNWHKKHKAAITIVGCHNEISIPYGVLELSNGELQKLSEKPTHDVLINTGLYIIEPHIIPYIPKNKKIDMNELIDLVSKREKVSDYPTYGTWIDIGQSEEYKKSVKHFQDLGLSEE